MVNFKLKLFIAKLEIEGHISGYRGIALCLESAINWVRIGVEWREKKQSAVRPKGWPQKLLLQLLSTWCVALKKVPGAVKTITNIFRDIFTAGWHADL